MPFRQERMLAILKEAIAFRAAYYGIRKLIADQLAAIGEGRAITDNDFYALSAMIDTNFPPPREEAISTERQHYRATYKRNIRERERASARRHRELLNKGWKDGSHEIISDDEIFAGGDTLQTITDPKLPSMLDPEAMKKRFEEYEAEERKKAGLK